MFTWRERPELLTHDLAMVVAFLALALAATSPPASAMVLAAAAILTSTLLAPVPGLSPEQGGEGCQVSSDCDDVPAATAQPAAP